MKEIYIYKLIDPETNHVRYVGKTTNVVRRLQAHITRSKQNKYHSARWVKSLLDKGLKPILEIVEICTEDTWIESEKFWIQFYRVFYDLTNITDGGEGNATYGRLGKPWSDEHRENNRKARLGVSVNRTDEGNKNRAEGVRRFYDSNKKPVLQYDLQGNFIKEWDCAVNAAKVLNARSSNITRACKNFSIVVGFQWRYREVAVERNIGAYIKTSREKVREISQYSEDGELIENFKNVSTASMITGISRTNISNCLSGLSKTAGGYIWKDKI